jgi:hypothetical protein
MKLILLIIVVLSSIIQYAPQVVAQTEKTPTTSPQTQPRKKPRSSKKNTSRPVFVPPKPPRNLSPVSGRRRGMGSRDNCPNVSIPLTALAPFQNKQESKQAGKSNTGIVGGLTTLEKPKFLFYVPYTTDNLADSSAEFSLLDSKGNDVHRTQTALPAKPGVISISLPNTVSLQPDQIYRWYFKVRCSNKKASLPIYVEGYIQRNNLDFRITEQLKTATNPQQKIAIYAKEGIWFDALNMLAELRQSSENATTQRDWQSLLQSVDLGNVSTAPFVD